MSYSKYMQHTNVDTNGNTDESVTSGGGITCLNV